MQRVEARGDIYITFRDDVELSRSDFTMALCSCLFKYEGSKSGKLRENVISSLDQIIKPNITKIMNMSSK